MQISYPLLVGIIEAVTEEAMTQGVEIYSADELVQYLTENRDRHINVELLD